jgi:hypothetical protein
MFVSDQYRVKLVDVYFQGGKAGQRFAFSQAGIDEDAGAFTFKQCEISGTTGS